LLEQQLFAASPAAAGLVLLEQQLFAASPAAAGLA
jgi:hypothetical protein